jgi:hypothetical protein
MKSVLRKIKKGFELYLSSSNGTVVNGHKCSVISPQGDYGDIPLFPRYGRNMADTLALTGPLPHDACKSLTSAVATHLCKVLYLLVLTKCAICPKSCVHQTHLF